MEHQYLSLIKDILENGFKKDGRNGDTLSVFGRHLKFDLRDSFPLLTTKKMFTKGIIEELLFFIRGETDTKVLENQNINIWKPNTDRKFLDSLGRYDSNEGDLGTMYGYIWRHFGAPYDKTNNKPLNGEGIDQLQNVVDKIRKDPNSRRILLTTYNPSQVDEGVLYPCHSITIQFYVEGGFLDMFCYNRSSDVGLGLPFNIASSALFLMIIAKLTNLKARFMNLSLGDCHIYVSHKVALAEQIERLPMKFPTIIIPDIKEIEDVEKLTYKDFEIVGYECHPAIKMEMIA
jgi:thymidylate synthase